LKKLLVYIVFFATAAPLVAQKKGLQKPLLIGEVKIIFEHHYNGYPIVLHDSNYTNKLGETFVLHKLKYYVGNLVFFCNGKKTQRKQYFLIDESKPASKTIVVYLQENNYDSLQVLFGIDSSLNVSGAQTGALDVVNDMFWTWNSGYVMQKLEAQSPHSKAINQKVEYHLGGYSGRYKAQQQKTFYFTSAPLAIKKDKPATIIMRAALDGFWQNDFSIASQPVCNTAGEMAGKLSQRFCQLFSASLEQ
jgi:hypothetical protein